MIVYINDCSCELHSSNVNVNNLGIKVIKKSTTFMFNENYIIGKDETGTIIYLINDVRYKSNLIKNHPVRFGNESFLFYIDNRNVVLINSYFYCTNTNKGKLDGTESKIQFGAIFNKFKLKNLIYGNDMDSILNTGNRK